MAYVYSDIVTHVYVTHQTLISIDRSRVYMLYVIISTTDQYKKGMGELILAKDRAERYYGLSSHD